MNDRWSFQYPQLYTPGQLNVGFNKRVFLRCVMHSTYSSLILFFIPWAAIQDTVRDDGKDIADYQSFALLAQTCLLVVVSIQVRSADASQSCSHDTHTVKNTHCVWMLAVKSQYIFRSCVWTPVTGQQ